jgi:hypothetical protein
MNRITNKDLEAVVKAINTLTNMPAETYLRDKNGKLLGQIGNYHLSYAYGGVALHQLMSKSGGVNDIFYGHMSKRELYGKMQAFIKGIEASGVI